MNYGIIMKRFKFFESATPEESIDMCLIFFPTMSDNRRNRDLTIVWSHSDNIELDYVIKTYHGTIRSFRTDYGLNRIMYSLDRDSGKYLPEIPTVNYIETTTDVYINFREIHFDSADQMVDIHYREYINN